MPSFGAGRPGLLAVLVLPARQRREVLVDHRLAVDLDRDLRALGDDVVLVELGLLHRLLDRRRGWTPSSSRRRPRRRGCPSSPCRRPPAARATRNCLSSLSNRSLRICTPLLPTASRSWTLNDSSKSLYFFFVQKNVLYFGSSIVSPTMVLAFGSSFQMSVRPSQLSGLRNSSVSSARATAARAGATASATRQEAREAHGGDSAGCKGSRPGR